MDPITTALLEKTELLMELRGYQGQDLNEGKEVIDVTALQPDSKKTILLRIVTKSSLKSDVVGVDKVRELEETLQEQKVDKAIILGRRFTRAAITKLKEDDIEFLSMKHDIVPFINMHDLYLKIRGLVDAICEIKCGRIPQSEEECKGFSKEPTKCPFCKGSGRVENANWNQKCPICGGTGHIEHRYSCDARLLSDNADFHLERGWINLLQNDLLSLLKQMRIIKLEKHKTSPFQVLLADGAPAN